MYKSNNEITEVKSDVHLDIENKGVTDTEVSIGKFKSIQALYNAYVSLEKEYTRKCQQFKAVDNVIAPTVDYKSELAKLAVTYPQIESYVTDVELLIQSMPLANALLEVVLDNDLSGGCDEVTEEFLQANVYSNEEVRKKIFEDMIEELSSIKSPKTANMRGKIIITPSNKPKTLGEAGSMAKKLVKTRRIN